MLHDPGRRKEDTAKKPIGSVHGASVGVHASDAANAWRNIARVSDRRNTYASQTFAVSASLGVKSFPELAAAIKAKPKTFNYIAAALSKDAFMAAFNQKNGTDVVRLPFKGGGDTINSILNGTAQIAIFGIGNLVPFLRDNKVVGLAVDGDKRSPLAPEIPTFRETGYTEHIAATFFGIYAPAGTPQPIIDKLNKAIVAVEIEARLPGEISDQPRPDPVLESAEDFAKELPADRAEGLATVKASGLYPDVK